jgi:nicotinate-nucleotide adenylyltransferase
MGGTFDPVHHGHLAAASDVAHALGLDEVVFVPTGQPWQKADRRVSPAEHRLAMSAAAVAADPRFTVSRVDVDRPGPTYAVDTLTDLRAAYGDDAELWFITGSDALALVMGWHRSAELFGLARFVGVDRPGHPRPDLSGFPPGSVTHVEVPALAISSTDLRTRVAQGRPVDYLVPDAVVQYIRHHHLYRDGT